MKNRAALAAPSHFSTPFILYFSLKPHIPIYMHGMAPDYLCHMIYVLPPSKYDLRRNHDPGVLFTSPKVRIKNTTGDRSFSCAAPRLWNLLPSDLRSISSLTIFKSRLKTFLFNKAFNWGFPNCKFLILFHILSQQCI